MSQCPAILTLSGVHHACEVQAPHPKQPHSNASVLAMWRGLNDDTNPEMNIVKRWDEATGAETTVD